jgi:hypothetical protein
MLVREESTREERGKWLWDRVIDSTVVEDEYLHII